MPFKQKQTAGIPSQTEPHQGSCENAETMITFQTEVRSNLYRIRIPTTFSCASTIQCLAESRLRYGTDINADPAPQTTGHEGGKGHSTHPAANTAPLNPKQSKFCSPKPNKAVLKQQHINRYPHHHNTRLGQKQAQQWRWQRIQARRIPRHPRMSHDQRVS